MELIVIASGSTGNCCLIRAGGVSVLVDAGISLRRMRTLLGDAGAALDGVEAVFVTHEHADHIAGLDMLAKQYPELKIYAPRAAAARITAPRAALRERIEPLPQGEVRIGGLTVRSFATPHDSAASVCYRFDSPEGALAVCTDLGCVTPEIREGLLGVRGALIECNHDDEMLRYGPYPVYLKRRILSDNGHLSNEAGAELAVELVRAGARSLILGHISRENNRPELALKAVRTALEREELYAETQTAPPLGAVHIRLEGEPCRASR